MEGHGERMDGICGREVEGRGIGGKRWGMLKGLGWRVKQSDPCHACASNSSLECAKVLRGLQPASWNFNSDNIQCAADAREIISPLWTKLNCWLVLLCYLTAVHHWMEFRPLPVDSWCPINSKKKKKKKEYLYIFTLTVPYYQDLPRGEHTEHSAGVKRRRKRVCASPPLPGVQLSIKCKAQYGISSCVLDSAGTEGRGWSLGARSCIEQSCSTCRDTSKLRNNRREFGVFCTVGNVQLSADGLFRTTPAEVIYLQQTLHPIKNSIMQLFLRGADTDQLLEEFQCHAVQNTTREIITIVTLSLNFYT